MIADRTTLSIAKAGELVGVTRRTIYNWIAGDKVEYVRTAGGSVRILRRYTVARSACRRHPAGYARNLGRRLNTLRGLNVALPRLPAPLRRASPVPWSGAPPQAATGASAPSAPDRLSCLPPQDGPDLRHSCPRGCTIGRVTAPADNGHFSFRTACPTPDLTPPGCTGVAQGCCGPGGVVAAPAGFGGD